MFRHGEDALAGGNVGEDDGHEFGVDWAIREGDGPQFAGWDGSGALDEWDHGRGWEVVPWVSSVTVGSGAGGLGGDFGALIEHFEVV